MPTGFSNILHLLQGLRTLKEVLAYDGRARQSGLGDAAFQQLQFLVIKSDGDDINPVFRHLVFLPYNVRITDICATNEYIHPML